MARSVLIAEDNEDEALLLRRAFAKRSILNPLLHVIDGEAAINFFHECRNRPADWPVLVLLDIKMPRFNGFEVLTWVRSQAELSEIPVVMMTASSQPQDLERAIRLGATDYIVKPSTFNDLLTVADTINQRWLCLPSKQTN